MNLLNFSEAPLQEVVQRKCFQSTSLMALCTALGRQFSIPCMRSILWYKEMELVWCIHSFLGQCSQSRNRGSERCVHTCLVPENNPPVEILHTSMVQHLENQVLGHQQPCNTEPRFDNSDLCCKVMRNKCNTHVACGAR